MLAWIITILIASIAVIVGVLVVHQSKTPETDKVKIFTVIGLLIFISLTVSTFKQQRLFNFSLLNSRYRNEIQQVYTSTSLQTHIGERIHIDKLDIQKLGKLNYKQYYKENYPTFPYSNQQYQEKIIFKSKKFEGCSFFLKKLAQTFRSYNTPTLYIYLSEPVFVDSLDRLANLFGLPDFMIMKQAFLSFRRKGVFSYIMIDNPQNLFLNIGKKNKHNQLSEFDYFISEAQISMILNVQKPFLSSFQSVFSHLMDTRQFQIKDWRIPRSSVANQWVKLQSQVSLNYQFDQVQPNFINLHRILKQNNATSQHITNLMIKNDQLALAEYFGVAQSYRKISEAQYDHFSIQQLKKLEISFRQLEKLQQVNLLTVQNGIFRIRK